jgi:hypothetical protein
MWNLVLVHLEIVLVSVQYRCTVYAKLPWALKSFWIHPMELQGDTGHVESRYSLFRDSVSVVAR